MRIFYFSILVCIALFLPFWAFIIGACIYGLLYTPYELLVLALLVDAEFVDPNRSMWYVYTIAASIVLVGTTYAKPYLRFYQ